MQASSQLASADVAGGRGRRRRPASASRGRAARPRAAAVNTNGARAAGAGGGRGRATRGAHTGTVTRIDMFQPILATRDEEEARGGSSWRRAPPLHSTSQAKSVGLASGLPEANGRAVRQPSAYAGGVKGRMVGGRRAVARGSGDPDVVSGKKGAAPVCSSKAQPFRCRRCRLTHGPVTYTFRRGACS